MSKEKNLPEPSEEFIRALRDAGCIDGGIVRTCNCGRTYFSEENYMFDEGEFEGLMEKLKEDPKNFILGDEPTCVNIGGNQFVLECPCNELSKYETLFWDSRYIFANYVEARAKRELENAQGESKLAKKVKTFIK